jgi:hypothetical protein
MKAILIIASTLALSAPVAFAECAGHAKMNTSAAVDTEIKTASIEKTADQKADEVLITQQKADTPKAVRQTQ